MFDFSAIDTQFITRLFAGIIIYWILGIFAKGIFEPIQAHLGQKLIGRIHRHSKELKNYADQTCTELDDIFISNLTESISRINGIVNRGDIPQSDQQSFRQLVTDRYQLSILFEKLGLNKTN